MACLLVVDMQNDFCSPDSVLCVKGAYECLPKVKEAIEIARQKGVHVIWIIREHNPSGVDVELFRAHLYKHGQGPVTPGSNGAALVEGFCPKPGELTVVKTRFSAFFATNLDLLLRRLGVRDVVVCGVQTPNCVRATAVDALGLDYRVTVLADATASKSDVVQENNLEDMRCMSIATPTVAAWAASLIA